MMNIPVVYRVETFCKELRVQSFFSSPSDCVFVSKLVVSLSEYRLVRTGILAITMDTDDADCSTLCKLSE